MSTLRTEVNRILQKIKAGNEQYKEVLFNLTYNHLKIIARMYVYNKNDVEDVLQAAYLRVFKYIKTSDFSKDGYNWLCRIVQNEAYSFNRANPSYLSLEECRGETALSDMTDLISQKDEIYRYLKKYSELDCKLIYLKIYDGYSYLEIANKMNMKKSNVHRRISKVFKEIIEQREKELDEDKE